MTRTDRPSWIHRLAIALRGLSGEEAIELLANLAWLG
jgi:hypothetical protein